MSMLERIWSAMVTKVSVPAGGAAKGNGSARLAIPSLSPGGIDAPRSGHFGRCDCFTLVDMEKGKVKDVNVVLNPPHVQGDCLSPVDLLKLHGTDAIIVGGIGMRPLAGFREAGMEVFIGSGERVSDVILEFIVEALRPVTPEEACGGH